MEIAESIRLLPDWLPIAALGVLGLLIGSFLNVVIHRLPLGHSVVTPRSRCPKCGHHISALENIPVLSWTFLRGQCRGCKARISARYPAIELLTAALFILCFLNFGFSLALPFALFLSSAAVALAMIDAEHMILPNKITYPLFVVFLVFRIIESASSGWDVSGIFQGMLGAIIGGGFLWGLGALWKVLRGIEGMGLGDVKMMGAVGMFLGWELVLFAIFVGAFTGAIGGMFLSRRDSEDNQIRIPFGVFLAIGSVISMFVGSDIIEWYLSQFGI